MPIISSFLISAAGGVAGYFTFSSYLCSRRQNEVLCILIVFALTNAVLPNIGQQLYDLGMSFHTMDVLNNFSYFIVAFATVCAWMFLRPLRRRWLLIALVPVSLAQPILSTLVIIGWSIGGFAP